MGYLERFAKSRKRGDTVVITARIPRKLGERFKKHCDRLNLTVSEAVYLLIHKEMQGEAGMTTSDGEMYTKVYSPDLRPRLTRPRRSGSGSRGLVGPYTVDGMAPCPVCKTWYSATNLSRHMKNVHGSDTATIYEQHLDVVKEMAREARGEAEGG